MVFLALALVAAVPETGKASEVFECRAANPTMPSLSVVRTEEDRRLRQRSFTYEAAGQHVFGLPAEYLSHVRSRDGESGLDEFNYSAVVKGELDHVRWLFERANPDMRCIRNSGAYTCLVAAQIGTKDGAYHKVRSGYIGRTSNDPSLDNANGILITCSWMEHPAP